MVEEETSYRMEGIAFGMVDGMILCLGLTIGVAEATSSSNLVNNHRNNWGTGKRVRKCYRVLYVAIGRKRIANP